LKLIVNPEGALYVNADDDIVSACLMTQAGAVLRR
jgi:NAD/NADP transhydrogenase alpha subunit